MTSTQITFDNLPNEQDSLCEVFIIESVTEHDGYVLFQQLKLLGGRPRYIPVRNLNDFKAAMAVFRMSNYRFLHISCHGDKSCSKVKIGKTWYFYESIADAFPCALKSRRVSFSACELGNDDFTRVLNSRNHWIHSITAPSKAVDSKIAAAYWVSFYTLCFQYPRIKGKKVSIASKPIEKIIETLNPVFGGDFYFAYSDTVKKCISSKQICQDRWIENQDIPYSSFKLAEVLETTPITGNEKC